MYECTLTCIDIYLFSIISHALNCMSAYVNKCNEKIGYSLISNSITWSSWDELIRNLRVKQDNCVSSY